MGDGCGDGDGDGDGATRVRLSVPRPIRWCMENGASASADCGGVLPKAHMIFCISSSEACTRAATLNIKKPSTRRSPPNLLTGRVNAICGLSTETCDKISSHKSVRCRAEMHVPRYRREKA